MQSEEVAIDEGRGEAPIDDHVTYHTNNERDTILKNAFNLKGFLDV